MNKINQLFQKKRERILSIYFTAGFPQLDDTGNIILSLQNAGIDLIEVGIPFSDPMADGKVIQDSNTQALRNGMSLKFLFGQLYEIKTEVKIPLILMSYLNPIIQYGFEAFCRDAKETGISGIIIPDIPFNDYLQEYKSIADFYELNMTMLITPETPEERIRRIDEHTNGFIYMVSSAATTGAQKSFGENTLQYFRRINNINLKNPRLIGFGISNPITLEQAFNNASGAIVGSKFISLLNENRNVEDAVKELETEFIHKINF